MFSYLKGWLRGRKLAIQSAGLCKDIVNFLITKNFHIQLPDTTYILQESYAICLLVSTRPGISVEERGSIIVTSQPILKGWLLKVFSLAKNDYDFGGSVEAVIAGLSQFFEGWMTELTEKNSDLVGKSIYKWIPAATAQFIDHVDFYVYNKFGRSPDKFGAVLCAMVIEHTKKLLPFRDKQRLASSLETDLPEDFKERLRNQ